MSTIITPSEEQINIVVNDEKISINVESGDVIVNVNEQIVEVSTVNGGYPLPTTVYSVFGRTGNIIAVDGDYDLGELGDVTLVSSTNGDVLTYDGTKWINKAVTGTGTVTSVDMSVPVGLQVSGNPITINGTLALNYAAGYSLPTTAKQTTWDTAYNDSIISASVSGTTTKTLTLNQQDGGTITASWTDIDTNLVTSVNGYVGTVVLTTSDIAEGSRLYYTETRVSNNVDVAANTAARHSAVTIGTANGLSLASQVLSLALASASTTGALSSTDWATFNNKVPYSGATGNVTLGEYQLSAGQIAFDQSPTGTAGVGILRWNDSDGTLDLGLKGGNVTLQVGQEMVARVVNKTGADLLESGYKVVRISSAQGQRLAVQLAQANNDTNSTDTIGIVTETIVNNQEGFITILGQVKEINTTGSLQGETWTDGDVLYLSPTTAGNITNIKPIAPSHMVVVGYVEYAHAQHGKIYCKTQNGYELDELHDCYLPTYVSNGVLYRDTTNNLWKNASIATVLGYTPISLTSLSGVSPLSYDNTNGAFSIAQATTSANGYLSSTDWNTFNGKQAALNGTGFVKISGTTISYDNSTYYLASNPSAYIALTGLSATAPLSYNNTTGGFTISQAGVSGNGYLSSTDWNTFNNKQASGNYITALSGEATASGPGSAVVTLSTSAVTGKLLTGVNITGGSISATDSILVAFGKVQNQINGVLGGAIYQSVWNASTNSPTLTSGTGTKGYYYIVSVAGSTNLDGITDWKIGDWAIFNGATWDKVDNTDAVSSVNGFTGAVSLTTANISEVTNLYYTEGRVSANTDVAANTAARHAAVTLGTANGLSLSTQALSLGLASTSATGALSSTDWNTFNLKQAALTLTTTGTSGAATLIGATLNIPNYNSMVYPGAGIAVSTGSAWGTSITDNSANWNTAYTNRITSATAPLSIISNVIAMSEASGSVDGFLSRFDWVTFNNKQATITLTTTGTSGAATFTSNTLNIPNYGSALSGYLPLTGGTLTGALNGTSASFSSSLNTDTKLQLALWDAINWSGTILKVGGVTSSQWQQTDIFTNGVSRMSISNSAITLYQALSGTSATFSGRTNTSTLYVNSTEYTFAYYVTAVIGPRPAADGIANLWLRPSDASNNVGTALSSTSSSFAIGSLVAGPYLSIALSTGAATFSSSVLINGATGNASTIFDAKVSTNNNIGIRTGVGIGSFGTAIQFHNDAVSAYTIGAIEGSTLLLNSVSGGNVLIGTTTDSGYKLDVNGTGRFTSNLTTNGIYVGRTTNGQAFGCGNGIDSDLGIYVQTGNILFTNTGTSTGFSFAIGGTTRFSIASTGAATFSSSITATSFFESSSIKGKDIIATNPLLALDIDVIKYTRKNDESKDIRYGYSAEQIHSLMPELTDKDVTAVKYLDVHTILISQLQQEIKDLKAKLN